MIQKLRQRLQPLDLVFFSPLLILTLTQFLPSNPILGLISMLVICTFPGYALLNRFKINRISAFQDLFFSVLLSILLLQCIYTIYSVFCYGVGFQQSITKPQVFLLAIIILSCSAVSLIQQKDSSLNPNRIFKIIAKPGRIKFALYLIPLTFPFISLIAVTRLNYRNDSLTTGLFLYVCVGILLFLCSGTILKKSAGLHYSIFYCTLLALLFGSTFRGDGGFWGWDINQEFAVAMRVLLEQHWIPRSQSSYNAMLSITVLPVVLSFLTNFSLTIIFKLFYALLAALIPLASYSLLKRFVRHSIAMPVVIIETIGSISYIVQMPGIVRQVVGLAFFVGILLVIFNPTWERKDKTKIILIFTCGLSFSHYSSAYLYTIIVLLSGLISFALHRIGSFRREKLIPVVNLRLGLAILAIVLTWNVVLNNSAQDANTVSQSLITQGPNFLPNKTGNFLDRWLSGIVTTPEASPGDFKSAVLEYNFYKFPTLKPNPISFTYEAIPADYPKNKPLLGTSTATIFYWLYILINTVFQVLIAAQLLFAFVSILGTIPRRKGNNDIKIKSQMPSLLHELIPLASASLFAAIFLRISATGGTFYNPERGAFQLAFIFSLPLALLLSNFFRAANPAHRIFRIGLIISCFVFLQQATGLIGYIYGSPSSRISSFMGGQSPYVISQSERSASDWIDLNIPKNSYLQSDVTANLVNLQKNIFGKRLFIAQTAPFGVFVNSYLYLSKANLETGVTRQSIGGLTAIRVPINYLDQNLSVVYSSGGARVYR